LSSMLEVDEINLQKYIFKEKMVEVIIAEYDNKPARLIGSKGRGL